MQRRKTRTRRRELSAAVAAALCLGGCGSGSQQRAAPQPNLPAPVATSLAARSDAVAQALAAGDSCGALDLAKKLQSAAISALNGRRVPAAFQEQLVASVNDLVSRIECVPVEEPHDRGKHKGKRKKEHGGKD